MCFILEKKYTFSTGKMDIFVTKMVVFQTKTSIFNPGSDLSILVHLTVRSGPAHLEFQVLKEQITQHFEKRHYKDQKLVTVRHRNSYFHI